MSVICAGKPLVILKVGGVWGENAGDGAENMHTHTCLETASIYLKWEKDYDRGCVPILDIGSHFVASARQLPYIVYCSNLNVDSRKVCNNAATLLSMPDSCLRQRRQYDKGLQQCRLLRCLTNRHRWVIKWTGAIQAKVTMQFWENAGIRMPWASNQAVVCDHSSVATYIKQHHCQG